VTDDPLKIKVGGVDMAFNTFFQLDFPKSRVEENQVNLLIYDIKSERELLWIPEITLK
jgi:hypothetical protein